MIYCIKYIALWQLFTAVATHIHSHSHSHCLENSSILFCNKTPQKDKFLLLIKHHAMKHRREVAAHLHAFLLVTVTPGPLHLRRGIPLPYNEHKAAEGFGVSWCLLPGCAPRNEGLLLPGCAPRNEGAFDISNASKSSIFRVIETVTEGCWSHAVCGDSTLLRNGGKIYPAKRETQQMVYNYASGSWHPSRWEVTILTELSSFLEHKTCSVRRLRRGVEQRRIN